jgi:transposase
MTERGLLVERVCGLDVHKKVIVACLYVGQANEKPRKVFRKFGTMTRDLLALKDWLQAEECKVVGMESTGVYWKPVYYVLEDGNFELIVGNARAMRNDPGRKTDMRDSEWIAYLLRVSAIRKSFVPPTPIRRLRDLVRYRTKLVQMRTAERNRLLALLETANIKLASVAADVFGVSGMAMVKALIAGNATSLEIASLARGRMRKKQAALELALDGRVDEHHRLILETHLEILASIDQALAKIDARLEEQLKPYAHCRELLVEIPGVDRTVAATIIAELGTDMTVFHGPHNLASWAGLCPGNNESAGKHHSTRTRKGNVHLRTMLVQAAVAASRTRGTYLKAKYHRLKARLGAKRAAVAIAHRILVTAYCMLNTGEAYRELGDTYLDTLDKKRVTRKLINRLEALGFDVQIKPREVPAPAAV